VQRCRAQRDDELAALLVDEQHPIGSEVEGFLFQLDADLAVVVGAQGQPDLSPRGSVLSTSTIVIGPP
jgi:hypothetical protein